MASIKKQEKTSTVLEQAAPAPGDQNASAAPSGSVASSADAVASGAATTAPGADSGINGTEGDPVTDLPTGLAPVANSTKNAASPDVSLSQSSQAGEALDAAAYPARLDKLSLSDPVELNPTQIEVYPLRSFMDEGELRRRGGPSYLVSRLHAEDLERRKLVSRQPLGE
ncbi:hypothetical protein [Pseudomonas fulva]|uniref:hypothetical protein n=1 Tax=Pseudomonas fulva TaxID=47880 RepID=UPI000D9BA21E|nr:hypothetical protein [Pseudomonas fulva]PYB87176.1 hypothetical protein DMX01_17885 [Pseudomonas fulva]PYC10977.1 hypothetical protein DMX00_18655 [Pseudomonas fulva]